ncbi:MAG: hypothetical protein IJQ68_10360 [Methanobrevibacter sp.]|uniref:hypothetical protein n=1 Tax=Methanobrevibacter sp. TaxID=66852 RepID=UPI0025D40B0E|nr:hypothetical protein [Methanobrevibacter sp.]MBR0272369.1 hypothetical protein [Methanobrevibacter sp.]
MTSKKNTDEKEIQKTETANKLTLFEAVQNHEEQNPVIIGALSKAGLLNKYRHEQHAIITGTEDINPSITMNELDKIIKKFLKGE